MGHNAVAVGLCLDTDKFCAAVSSFNSFSRTAKSVQICPVALSCSSVSSPWSISFTDPLRQQPSMTFVVGVALCADETTVPRMQEVPAHLDNAAGRRLLSHEN